MMMDDQRFYDAVVAVCSLLWANKFIKSQDYDEFVVSKFLLKREWKKHRSLEEERVQHLMDLTDANYNAYKELRKHDKELTKR